jgi:peptidoglycan/LPS O-acetylase OafA/YrhL
LNALRFFAAFCVVMHHAEQIRSKHGLFNLKQYSLFENGGTAVTFFFVLSGFLISYLLLKEQYHTGKISVKNFYMRRVLRIWPLYFLLVLLGTVFVPVLIELVGYSYDMPYRFGDVILYFLFFLPFMVTEMYGTHLLQPLWSIGVEEYFYLGWAPLFKFLKRHVLKAMITIIVLKWILFAVVIFTDTNNLFIKAITGTFRFEAMAIGGLGAYIVFHGDSTLSKSVLFSKTVQWIMLAFLLLRFCCDSYMATHFALFKFLFATFIFSDFLLMFVFTWLIVNISLNPQTIVKLNSKFLDMLGNISYGIYMYHMPIIFIIVFTLKNRLNRMDNIISTLVFYCTLTTGVILISYLSKKYFEDFFLKLKERY